ncbi:hypothetical protein BH09BAC6_BH09BAC6_02900 [soil metagenome]|jgi:hypothetical protein
MIFSSPLPFSNEVNFAQILHFVQDDNEQNPKSKFRFSKSFNISLLQPYKSYPSADIDLPAAVILPAVWFL